MAKKDSGGPHKGGKRDSESGRFMPVKERGKPSSTHSSTKRDTKPGDPPPSRKA